MSSTFVSAVAGRLQGSGGGSAGVTAETAASAARRVDASHGVRRSTPVRTPRATTPPRAANPPWTPGGAATPRRSTTPVNKRDGTPPRSASGAVVGGAGAAGPPRSSAGAFAWSSGEVARRSPPERAAQGDVSPATRYDASPRPSSQREMRSGGTWKGAMDAARGTATAAVASSSSGRRTPPPSVSSSGSRPRTPPRGAAAPPPATSASRTSARMAPLSARGDGRAGGVRPSARESQDLREASYMSNATPDDEGSSAWLGSVDATSSPWPDGAGADVDAYNFDAGGSVDAGAPLRRGSSVSQDSTPPGSAASLLPLQERAVPSRRSSHRSSRSTLPTAAEASPMEEELESFCQSWEGWAQAIVNAVEKGLELPEPPQAPAGTASQILTRILEASTLAAAALARNSVETEGLRIVVNSLESELARSRAEARRLQESLRKKEGARQDEQVLRKRCEDLKQSSEVADETVRRLREEREDLQSSLNSADREMRQLRQQRAELQKSLDAERVQRRQATDEAYASRKASNSCSQCSEAQKRLEEERLSHQDADALRRKEIEDAWCMADSAERKYKQTLEVLRSLMGNVDASALANSKDGAALASLLGAAGTGSQPLTKLSSSGTETSVGLTGKPSSGSAIALDAVGHDDDEENASECGTPNFFGFGDPDKADAAEIVETHPRGNRWGIQERSFRARTEPEEEDQDVYSEDRTSPRASRSVLQYE